MTSVVVTRGRDAVVLVPAAAAGAVVVGVGAAAAPLLATAGLAVVVLVLTVIRRPATAAYLTIGLTPLLAGIDRGTLVPVLRPNEALDVLLAGALCLGFLLRPARGRSLRKLEPVEKAMLAMALAASVLPLVWMGLRQIAVTADDVQYALVLWKYLGVYLIVRASVRTDTEVRRCLWVSLAAGAAVGAVALAQVFGVSAVQGLLERYFVVNGNAAAVSIGRGSSTLALPAAMADLMCLNLAIAIGLMRESARHRLLLVMAVVLYCFAGLSSGEFSSALGLVVAGAAIVVVARDYRLLAWFPPVAVVGAFALWPVIRIRLSEFESTEGLPASWIGRLHNLQNYFWPQLLADNNYLLGVRSSARIAHPHRANGFIWIESGYSWLLWSGGLPLLAAFCYFVVTATRRGLEAARHCEGAVSVAGLALVTIVAVVSFLMLFDPHVTYRGTADALFGLVALAGVRTARGQPEQGAQDDQAVQR